MTRQLREHRTREQHRTRPQHRIRKRRVCLPHKKMERTWQQLKPVSLHRTAKQHRARQQIRTREQRRAWPQHRVWEQGRRSKETRLRQYPIPQMGQLPLLSLTVSRPTLLRRSISRRTILARIDPDVVLRRVVEAAFFPRAQLTLSLRVVPPISLDDAVALHSQPHRRALALCRPL